VRFSAPLLAYRCPFTENGPLNEHESEADKRGAWFWLPSFGLIAFAFAFAIAITITITIAITITAATMLPLMHFIFFPL
jgi:hypothetical protein